LFVRGAAAICLFSTTILFLFHLDKSNTSNLHFNLLFASPLTRAVDHAHAHTQADWVGSSRQRFQLAHYCVHDGRDGGLALVLWGACANPSRPVEGAGESANWEWCGPQ
jgi:hypothetical protein